MFGTDVPLIVVWLIGGGLFFMVYLRLINVRGFVHALQLVSGRFARAEDRLKAFLYLVGDRRLADLGFKLVFLSFMVLGTSVQLGSLVELSDALVFVVALPNLPGLYLLAPRIRREVLRYEDHIRSLG